jgi:hypothetical protein
MSAIGGIAQAQEQKNQLDQQAENERYQALLNDHRASVAQRGGEIEAERRAKQIAVDTGGQRAAFAGNGLLLDSAGETTGLIEDATVAEGWQDIGIIKDNAAMQVWGFQTNAVQQRQSAAEMNRQGKKGVKGAKVMAIASILTGQGAGGSSGGMQSYLASREQSRDSSAAGYTFSGAGANKSAYTINTTGKSYDQAYA